MTFPRPSTAEVHAHYEQIVMDAYTLNLQDQRSTAEYEEYIARPLGNGQRLLAQLAAPRSFRAESHSRLRDMYSRSASHVFFFYRPQERGLDSLRYFAEGFGMGFDRGEETYSSPQSAPAEPSEPSNPSIEEMALMASASLLFARGDREYGRVIRGMVRRLRQTDATAAPQKEGGLS